MRLRLGAAHQSLSLLALAAGVFGLISLVFQPINTEAAPVWLLVAIVSTALGYAFATSAWQWWHGQRLRRARVAGLGGQIVSVVAALLVAGATAAIVMLGQQSTLLLARIEALVTAIATVSIMVLLLSVAEMFLRRRDPVSQPPGDVPGKTKTHVVAFVGLAFAVAWALLVACLESRVID